MADDNRTPAELRSEADRLDTLARELRREATARERHAAGKRQCEGTTKSGRSCHNDALPGKPYCIYHDTSVPPEKRTPSRWDRHRAALPQDRGEE